MFNHSMSLKTKFKSYKYYEKKLLTTNNKKQQKVLRILKYYLEDEIKSVTFVRYCFPFLLIETSSCHTKNIKWCLLVHIKRVNMWGIISWHTKGSVHNLYSLLRKEVQLNRLSVIGVSRLMLYKSYTFSFHPQEYGIWYNYNIYSIRYLPIELDINII